MKKHWALGAALLGLGVSISCSSARSPVGPSVSVSAQNGIAVLYVGEANVQITATVSNTNNKAVSWSLEDQNGAACTDPATCGTLSSTSANPVSYTAPASPTSVTVVATSQADTRATGSLQFTIAAISVQVTPYNTNIGTGLKQQFTAVVLPDQAPQAVTWSASCGGCINANTGILTGPGATGAATVTATVATNGLSGSVTVPATVVSSRLPAGSYAFRISGFDVNTKLATAAAGTFTVGGSDNVTGGKWDELTSGGPQPCIFSGGTFTAVSNNQGKLALTGLCNGSNRSPVYNVVFDAAGDMQMIEADNLATGSGVIEPVPTGTFITSASSFVFGFTGVDVSEKRTGYAGFLPLSAPVNGQGQIGQGGTPGLIDINDNGAASSDSNVTGTYSVNNGIVSMTLNALGTTFQFHLYVVSGQASNKGAPLTLYAISTDNNPAVTGTVVFQDPKVENDATPNDQLNKNAIIALTGFDANNGGSNVSLSWISPDKKGNITGNFDQNDAGTIQSPGFSNTYCSSGSGSTCATNSDGRYIINLLGSSSGSPAGIPFVLYLSTANTGFLLDQSSASVMTGTMAPQILQTKDLVSYAPSELPSTYAAANTSCAGADPSGGPQCALVANLLLTWAGNGSCKGQCVSGTEWFGAQNPIGAGTTLGGGANDTYTLSQGGAGGTGPGGSSIGLTTPSNQTFVIYMLDVFDNLQPTLDTSHFLMIQVDKGVTNASIINVQQ